MGASLILSLSLLALCVLATSARNLEADVAGHAPTLHSSAASAAPKTSGAAAVPRPGPASSSSSATHNSPQHAATGFHAAGGHKHAAAAGKAKQDNMATPAQANRAAPTTGKGAAFSPVRKPVSSGSDRSSSRAPAGTKQLPGFSPLPRVSPIPNPPIIMASGGEPMTRLSRDIRQLQLTINGGRVNPIATFSDITAFTFAGDLGCVNPSLLGPIGTCALSSDLLLPPTDAGSNIYNALTTAICVLNTRAPDCDPQLSSGLTITATGILSVTTNGPLAPAVNQFQTAMPLIVDGVYSSSRPGTLLSSIVGFKTGNILITPVVKNTAGYYTGSMFLNLFKGGPLSTLA